MGNCYFMDHIAEDHTHTDITCTIEESQQKCRLGTVGNRLLGGGGGGGGASCGPNVSNHWRSRGLGLEPLNLIKAHPSNLLLAVPRRYFCSGSLILQFYLLICPCLYGLEKYGHLNNRFPFCFLFCYVF